MRPVVRVKPFNTRTKETSRRITRRIIEEDKAQPSRRITEEDEGFSFTLQPQPPVDIVESDTDSNDTIPLATRSKARARRSCGRAVKELSIGDPRRSRIRYARRRR